MHKLIMRAVATPGLYFEAAPTHDQAYHIFWDKLEKKLRYSGLLLSIDRTHRTFRIVSQGGYSDIRVVGLDKPSRIEGKEIRGLHITEFPDIKETSFWNNHIRPMLADEVQGVPIWVIADGTFDSQCDEWTDLIEDACGGVLNVPTKGNGCKQYNPFKDSEVVYNWVSADVLPPDEIEALKFEYNEPLFLQEFCGVPMRNVSRVYYGYGKHNESEIEFDNTKDTILAIDFNVTPFCASVWQLHTIDNKECKIAVHEFEIKDTNAEEATPVMIEWFKSKEFNPKPGQLTLTGDHAGNARNQSISATAWELVERTFNNEWLGIRRVTRPTKPGGVKDGQDTLNSRFKPYKAIPYYYVNRELCPKLHTDLMKLKSMPNGKQNDENGIRGHFSDGVRYLARNFDPIRKEITTSSGAL